MLDKINRVWETGIKFKGDTMIIRHRGKKFIADQVRFKSLFPYSEQRGNPMVWGLWTTEYPYPEREFLGFYMTQREMMDGVDREVNKMESP